MTKYYVRRIMGYSTVRNYYYCLSQLDRELDYISLDRSIGTCPYRYAYPNCYKRDLKVNMVFESTKIRSWEI